MKRMTTGIAVLAGVVLGSWLLLALSDDSEDPQEVGTASTAPETDDRGTVEGIGYTEPVTQVRRLAFRIGGIIGDLEVGVGDAVEQGDLLATLSNEREKHALELAEMELELAVAERRLVVRGINDHRVDAARRSADAWKERITYLSADFKRLQRLAAHGTIPEADSERAGADLHSAEAEFQSALAEVRHLENFVLDEDLDVATARVRVAEAEVKLARARVRDTELRAPSNGVILEVLRWPGEYASDITSDTPVLLLADLARLRVRAEISERNAHRIRTGQEALVKGRNLGNRTYKGQVVQIKRVMGDKTVFQRSASERKDLDVLQVFIEVNELPQVPVGLRVDVAIRVDS